VELTIRACVACVLLCAVAGCSRTSGAPEDVVALYFRSLGRDPIRSAALVTQSFHAHHGLRIQSTWTDVPTAQEPFRLSSAELAWLGVQRLGEYAAYATQLTARVTSVQRDDDLHATVTTRVAAPRAPPFTQRFFVVRTQPGAPWRIDRIAQEDLVPANRIAAFVASPSRDESRGLLGAGP